MAASCASAASSRRSLAFPTVFLCLISHLLCLDFVAASGGGSVGGLRFYSQRYTVAPAYAPVATYGPRVSPIVTPPAPPLAPPVAVGGPTPPPAGSPLATPSPLYPPPIVQAPVVSPVATPTTPPPPPPPTAPAPSTVPAYAPKSWTPVGAPTVPASSSVPSYAPANPAPVSPPLAGVPVSSPVPAPSSQTPAPSASLVPTPAPSSLVPAPVPSIVPSSGPAPAENSAPPSPPAPPSTLTPELAPHPAPRSVKNGDVFRAPRRHSWDRETSFRVRGPSDEAGLDDLYSFLGVAEQECQECTAANEAEETCRYVAEPVAQVSDVLLLPAANSQTREGTVSEESFVKKPVVPKKLAWSSWRKGRLLGSGSFGTVYEGLGDNGCFFAVKEVSLLEQGKRDECIMQLEQEINLLSKFQHKNIVQYLGTQTEMDKLYIFLEFVSQGSLASVYNRYEMFSDQIRRYTQQILCGLKYLHDHHIVHRDIKCANILVQSSGMVKLADFGLAKEVAKLGGSCVGSAYWMAPEVIDPKKTYNVAADIWSLGCTVLEMATRAPPNGDLERAQVLWKVGHGEAPPIPVDLPSDMIDFISQCLEVNVMKRPTVDALLMHTFVTGMPKLGPPQL
ncbi:unnamed protein product, partial [Sphagnum jensenii]